MGFFDFLFPAKPTAPVSAPAPTPVAPSDNSGLSDAAFKLIIDNEGLDQPYLHPGGDSGITIGVGDDLGYQGLDEFTKKWQSRLAPADFKLLTTALGIHGLKAAQIARNFRGIKIERAPAVEVFREFDIPNYVTQTKKGFPGVELLCANAFGAMVSLVFNRGASTIGSRRTEMANIKLVLSKASSPAGSETYKAVARELRNMKRLWIGQGLDGLITRREAEAKLVESCL